MKQNYIRTRTQYEKDQHYNYKGTMISRINFDFGTK